MKFILFKKQNGFTLIELLIVIAIIGLLSTMAVYAINVARMKAKATRIVADFKSFEKALYLLLDDENPGRWWREGEKSTVLTSFSGLSDYISIPSPPIAGTYGYDNDGDTLVEGASCCPGVNVALRSCGDECSTYFNLVDGIIDGGDGGNYGKVRYNGSIFYSIAGNEEY